MTTTVALRDHTEAIIRPMTAEDGERSLAFFRALPEEDRVSLRRDVTTPEVVRERIREMEQGRAMRLVAVVNGEIVADGSLELSGHSWEAHIAELRLIVAKEYQRKGLGVLMAHALYGLAATAQVEEIVVRMMRSQVAAVNIFQKLGFSEAVILRDYVKDSRGRKQDLIVMRCTIERLLRGLEGTMTGSAPN